MVKKVLDYSQFDQYQNLDANLILAGDQADIDAFLADISTSEDKRTSKFATAEIEITTGKSKLDTTWHTSKIDLAELVKISSTPHLDRKKHTQKEYEALSSDEKGAAKDVGGMMGAALLFNDSNRQKVNIDERTMLTLDIDYPEKADKIRDFNEMFSHIKSVLMTIFGYDVFFYVYTSRNATPQNPRMRVMIPFDKKIKMDEIKVKNAKAELVDHVDHLTSVAASRFVANSIGMEMFDQTGHDVNRLMYYPSVSVDGWFRAEVNLADILKTEDLKSAMKNNGINFADKTTWPVSKDEKTFEPIVAIAKGRGDGELTEQSQKPGMIGAFNTIYTPDLAIEKFLSDKYDDAYGNRYTWHEGSSSNGMIYYEDTELVYSRHDTDPINDGYPHNSYDMVRIHKFGDDDDSMKLMNKFIRDNCEEVVKLAEERKRDAIAEKNKMSDENDVKTGNLYCDDWLSFDPKTGKPIFQPSDVAAVFYEHNKGLYWANPDIKKDDYYYDEKSGVWIKNGQSWLDDKIRTQYLWALGKEADIARTVKDTRALYRQENKNVRSMRFPLANEAKIVLKNGVYDTKSGEFTEDFDPALYAIMNFPTIKYDQNAECQLFLEFIDHLFGSEQRQFVLAWMGYCMTSTYKYQHILLINGEGGIGKGTFITILQTLLNAFDSDPSLSATSGVNLASLTTDKFAAGGLFGKTANIDPDTKSGFHKFSEMLKSLSGGDSISMEKKGKDAEFRPNTAKLIFVGNGELSFKDNLSALLRRFHYLRCVPTDRSQNDPKFHDIHKKIQNSPSMLAGVFNAAMAAYREMVGWCEDNNTNFWKLPAKVEADTHEWINSMDILGQFIEEENEFFEKTDDADDIIHYQAMYSMYRATMALNGQAQLGENNFAREMSAHGMPKTRIKRFGRVLQGYRGFKIKKSGYLLQGITSTDGRSARFKQGTWEEFGFSG